MTARIRTRVYKCTSTLSWLKSCLRYVGVIHMIYVLDGELTAPQNNAENSKAKVKEGSFPPLSDKGN